MSRRLNFTVLTSCISSYHIILIFLLINTVWVDASSPVSSSSSMPLPWSTPLHIGAQGSLVTIAQSLLNRDDVIAPKVPVTGVFDTVFQHALVTYQAAYHLPQTGVWDNGTAKSVLILHSRDGFHDSGFSAASLGYRYKIHIPVHVNRSIETVATLFDAQNVVLLQFRVRTHGYRDNGAHTAWPDFGDNDIGLNQFTENGASVTGLMEIDLNSPEPEPQLYGPYPVNRFVRGLQGNAAFLMPDIRDGQLLHTGNWSSAKHPWTPNAPMPNSQGCVHAVPDAVALIAQLLVDKCGVEVRPNPFSGRHYPYTPQGIAVIEQVD